MENKNRLKNFTIVMMIVLLLVQIISNALSRGRNTAQGIHEIFGIITFLFVILHLIANRKWLSHVRKQMGKNTLSKSMKLKMIAAILLCLSFIGIIVTGILMSRVVLVNVGSPRNGATLGEVHGFFVFLSLALILWHLILNKNYLKHFVAEKKTRANK